MSCSDGILFLSGIFVIQSVLNLMSTSTRCRGALQLLSSLLVLQLSQRCVIVLTWSEFVVRRYTYCGYSRSVMHINVLLTPFIGLIAV